jgi:hypothetical protein
MSSINLNSESFQRAAYALSRAMENFGPGDFENCITRFERAAGDCGDFRESVLRFEQSVDKLGRILGMQAANDMVKYGSALAHDEAAFRSA